MAECKNCVVGVLGACSFEYCRTEREILLEEVLELATALGHRLSEFDKVKDYPVWQARCIYCGQLVAINLDPRPGESEITGGASSARCPGPDKGQQG